MMGKTPKMDGENNGKPYFLMDDLWIAFFLEHPYVYLKEVHSSPTTIEPEHDFHKEARLPGHHFQVSSVSSDFFGGVHKKNNQGVIV